MRAKPSTLRTHGIPSAVLLVLALLAAAIGHCGSADAPETTSPSPSAAPPAAAAPAAASAPAPPAPPAPPVDIQASVDISSKNMNPPRDPPAAFRAGIQGEVILIIDVDANGNVTNVAVEKSSRNRDLDRAAMEAARKWKFNPASSGGQKAAGRVRVPVNFALS